MGSPAVYYSDSYEVDIGSHVFPTSKYRLIKEKLISTGSLDSSCFREPAPAPIEEVTKLHAEKYVRDISEGTLSFADELRLELPYSRQLAEAAFTCCGGTIEAALEALETGSGFHIGGGFHHAYPDHGEGFCVFNDVAVAARCVSEKGVRVLVIDCDVHQGNGTAAAFYGDENVFTFSIHQENNYPMPKEKSDMDTGLPDGAGGDIYNSSLRRALDLIEKKFTPGLIIYIAGADPYSGDRLGGLGLSMEDLAERDRIVRDFSRKHCPAAVTLAGGYSWDVEDTVSIHAETVRIILNLPGENS